MYTPKHSRIHLSYYGSICKRDIQAIYTLTKTPRSIVEWTHLCGDAIVKYSTSGTESHNSLGQGERYHAMLHRVYNKVCASEPQMSRELSLSKSVKAMKYTAGPEGFVPSLRLFCKLPKIPQRSRLHLSPNARLKVQAVARAKSKTAKAKKRNHTALSRMPSEAHRDRFILDNQSMYIGKLREYEQAVIKYGLLIVKRFFDLMIALEQNIFTAHV